MSNKKFLLFFVFLFLFSSFVFGVPPEKLGTLTILKPDVLYRPYGVASEIHIHSLSTSTGQILNVTTYNCQIHVYNSYSEHVMTGIMTNSPNWYDKEFLLNSTVYNNLGQYFFNIWCYDTNLYGALTDTFYITRNGEEYFPELISSNNLFLNISLGMMALFCFWISILFKREDKNKHIRNIGSVFFYVGIIHLLIISLVMSSVTNCESGLCADINRFGSFGEAYFIIMGLLMVYVIYTYAVFKAVDTAEGKK